MIIPDEYVHEVLFPQRAFDQARAHYLSFTRLTFEDDLLDYLKTGFVCSYPYLFAMAKVIVHPRDKNKVAWFIRYSLGRVDQLVHVLPFPLPTVVFCRNDDGKLRIYSWENLKRKALRVGKMKRIELGKAA